MQGLRRLELELELELVLPSELVFKLPCRVANAELLAVVVGDACCMRWCSLNSLIRLIIDGASSSLRSL